ncbi:MAG: DNA-processing protein DprA [Candidatus Paceibacterota bacterium]|jgi:DNA processing protein
MKDNYQTSEHKVRELFPKDLALIPDSPDKIFVKGNIRSNQTRIAVVGTRKASKLGQETAYNFSYNLAQNGITIVSGLALGIDSSAHLGALDAKGVTWSVLANGLDDVYPHSNKKIAQRILENDGCLISEYSGKTPAYPNQFILRNRIISGLCQAILVIEAPEKSGSLATANFAKKQNRKIFVVPGPIDCLNFIGSNNLIKEGAVLTTSYLDILKSIGMMEKRPLDKSKSSDLPTDNQKIIQAIVKLGKEANIDNLSKVTKLTPQEIIFQITPLIIEGIVVEEGGKYRLRGRLKI